MKWIDNVIMGLYELHGSTNPYDLCDYLNIDLIKTTKNKFFLETEYALYIRDFNGKEVIFIRDDLSKSEEKFYLSHELGHAVLHPNISNSLNRDLINKGKLEKQADYFALKLNNINLDELYMREMTLEQIASTLELPVRAIKQLV